MDGEGMQVSCTLHFKDNKKGRLICWKRNIKQHAWLIFGDGKWIWTGVTKKVKTKKWHDCFQINAIFWSSVHRFFCQLAMR